MLRPPLFTLARRVSLNIRHPRNRRHSSARRPWSVNLSRHFHEARLPSRHELRHASSRNTGFGCRLPDQATANLLLPARSVLPPPVMPDRRLTCVVLRHRRRPTVTSFHGVITDHPACAARPLCVLATRTNMATVTHLSLTRREIAECIEASNGLARRKVRDASRRLRLILSRDPPAGLGTADGGVCQGPDYSGMPNLRH